MPVLQIGFKKLGSRRNFHFDDGGVAPTGPNPVENNYKLRTNTLKTNSLKGLESY